MSFEIVKGDLFDTSLEFDALAQGVNTEGNMGGGIAVEFRTRWPEMYQEYNKLCLRYGQTLGGLMHIWNADNVYSDEYIPTVYNLFSQLAPGRDGDYFLLKKATILLRQDAEQRFERVGVPWIGCGIAGLERHNVEYLFKQVLGDSAVQFVLVEQ